VAVGRDHVPGAQGVAVGEEQLDLVGLGRDLLDRAVLAQVDAAAPRERDERGVEVATRDDRRVHAASVGSGNVVRRPVGREQHGLADLGQPRGAQLGAGQPEAPRCRVARGRREAVAATSCHAGSWPCRRHHRAAETVSGEGSAATPPGPARPTDVEDLAHSGPTVPAPDQC
jgi:hypothetical protein